MTVIIDIATTSAEGENVKHMWFMLWADNWTCEKYSFLFVWMQKESMQAG